MSPEPIGQQAREALRRHVLEPLAARCVDHDYGGFLVDFDESWGAVGPQEKSLEHAARTTATFGLLDRVMPGEGCDRLALHGCDFLCRAMWDDAHGGFFARVDRQGRPLWDGLKHPHAVTYAAEAFQLCAEVLPPGLGALWAEKALDWLDEVAWDPVHGGYWGCYRRDNRRYLAGDPLPTADGRDPLGLAPGLKEINTQSDAIEALTSFTGGRSAERLRWMTRLVRDRLVDRRGRLQHTYWQDWSPAAPRIDIGYQLQTCRRLAALTQDSEDGHALVATCCRLVDFCFAAGRHPEGGFCYSVGAEAPRLAANEPPSDQRQWWVQFEAIHALHVLACHELVASELQARYRAARDEQWEFVRDNYFDQRHGGVREEPCADRGRRSRLLRMRRGPKAEAALKAHAWKDASHETKVFVALGFGDTGFRSSA